MKTLLFLVAVVVWTYAGYSIGLTTGKGWRAAVISGECRVEAVKL